MKGEWLSWWRCALLAGVLLTAVCACNLQRTVTVPNSPVLVPSETAPPVVDVSEGWDLVTPGITTRRMSQMLPRGTTPEAQLVRIDPAVVEARVHYTPDSPGFIGQWGDRLPAASVIVNGGFFDSAERALGLVVHDGEASGVSFQGYGGMFQVDASGNARVRSLVSEPFLGEVLFQAVQGFPMLIEPAGVMAPRGDGFDDRSFRTVMAQDIHGQIVIAVFHSLVSLADLQDWLLASDLGIKIAFGLDGGRSSALLVRGAIGLRMPSFDALPTVIAFYPR